ncbi:aldo/keto reductase [Fulvitalea axinellae]|uniref:Protein tas n=1 Tax=Fulvitalea axinellae TaxID=1182444 RepID=A0AAU9CUB6_9BACT|nr:aldo/keto reductase [Fulvitalea axinellae]
MKFNKLGNSDLLVSQLCLGTMTFGEQNTEKEGHDQINYALTKGVNFIDTAELYSVPARAETYGRTEEIIGSWIKKNRNKREDIILATKAAGPNDAFEYMRGVPNFSPQHLRKALHQSLNRLKTDYVDLYQLHWPERKTNFFGKLGYQHESDETGTDFDTVVDTLAKFISEGKISYFGLSNETPWGTMKFIEAAKKRGVADKLVSIQNPYSLLNRSYEVGMAEISIREKIGLLAYSPLGFGMLTGKYDDATPEDGRLSLFPKMARYSGDLARETAKRYNQLAKDNGLTPAQMALAFINSRPFLTSNIIGATTMDQLKENLSSVNISLSDEILTSIEEIHKSAPNPAP